MQTLEEPETQTPEVTETQTPTIIAVVGQKGGTGKTTTAMALAAEIGERHKTLLVDIDPQASAFSWAERIDDAPFDHMHDTDVSHLQRLKDLDYRYVVVDTPGSLDGMDALEAVVRAADFVLLPTMVSGLSVDPLIETVGSVVRPSGKPYAVLVNNVDTRSPGECDAFYEFLESQGLNFLQSKVRAYSVHRRAATEGRLVTRAKSFFDKSGRAAAADVKRMSEEVLERVGEK